MKTLLKVLGALVGLLVAGLLVGYVYVDATAVRDFSSTPLPKIEASKDPAVIARGDYLANAVAHCSSCHSPAESAKDHKLGPKGDLSGGVEIKAGPFGTYYPSNITPDPETGVGKLTDGQIARAVRHGVDRNGHFAPFMSFAVGQMSDEDLTAVISYVRSIPPVKRQVPPDEWGLIAKALAGKFGPKMEPVMKHVAETSTPTVERGEYLANGPAVCVGCHSEMDPMDGFKLVGAKFSGNPQAEPDKFDPTHEFIGPNLTPDPETGHITKWEEEFFVQRFRSGRMIKGSIMPWDNFSQMTDADLRSIYRYLRTLPPTKKVTGPPRRPTGWKPEGA